jgi:stage V sporulation protein G
MEITDVHVSLRNEKKLKGFVNIILDDLFIIRGLKIICGLKGYFIAMPNRKRKDGNLIDIAHPIRNEFREKMEKTILDRYWKELERIGESISSYDGTEIFEDQFEH